MKIIITSGKLIKDIQDDFSRVFPFLKIEFFKISGNKTRETINRISNLLPVGNVHKVTSPKQLIVSPLMTVKDFESDFENKFGMGVQLYRKSGNTWLGITMTDTWTIKQQDDQGNEISKIVQLSAISRCFTS